MAAILILPQRVNNGSWHQILQVMKYIFGNIHYTQTPASQHFLVNNLILIFLLFQISDKTYSECIILCETIHPCIKPSVSVC